MFYVIIYRRPCHKVRRSQKQYDAAVLYDEEDVFLRCWVENNLVEKVVNQWQMKLFVMGRDGETEGGEIEALARGIEQSDTLILCLSQHILELPIIRDQFRIALAGSRDEHKYIFVTFETSREPETYRNVPEECENVLRQLIFERAAVRQNWDPRTEHIFWRHLRRNLPKNFGSSNWCSVVGNGESAISTSQPKLSYTELLQRESNNGLDG